MPHDEQKSKLHVDADWKAEAQAEKEKLAAKERISGKDQPGGARGEMPEASFQTLMSVLASQAIMGLGAYADPKTGKAVVDLQGAQFSIDLLGVLEEKSKGNLTDEEASEIKQLLSELRNRYVQIAELVAKQQASAAGLGGGGERSTESGGGSASGPGGPSIIQP